ncbi:MAG: hypothetical protein KME54_13750 [Tolypothrix brevis GSE-NOS-MK-07-07A]|nr:hypothetical protein [Tolypothrix brevis GSE-NOS-MK-07-07A]
MIQQIFKEEYKAIAISHDVDLPIVIQHCLGAKKREFIRNLLLAPLFVAQLASSIQDESFHWWRDLIFLPFNWSNFIYFLVAFSIIIVDKWFIRYVRLAKDLSKANFGQFYLHLKQNERAKNILAELAKAQQSNVIVFGEFSPFPGSGFDDGGWSFSLNLNQGKEQMGNVLQPKPFQIEELYEFIAHHIKTLDLPGLSIEDKLCVDGEKIRDNKLFIAERFTRPYSQLNSEEIKKFVNTTAYHIRYYKHIKVISWNGDFIFSVFLRFVKNQKKIFVENSYFLLPPIKTEYRQVDTLNSKLNLRKVNQLLVESLLTTVFLSPFSPVMVVFGAFMEFWGDRKYRKEMRYQIKEMPNFNYGAITSVRELATSSNYTHYFQKLDREMYLKVIERQIIDSLSEFLDSKNIDTSELTERRTAIFNSGVLVSGGSFQATNVSSGTNTKAIINGVSGLVQSVTSKAGVSQKHNKK